MDGSEVGNLGYPGSDKPTGAQFQNEVRWFQKGSSHSHDEVLDKRDRAQALIAETAAIEMRQSTWHETNLWNASLFCNRELVGFRWGTIEAHGELIPKDLRSENLIEEIGESLLAKASSSPLVPSLVPHGRSYKTERAVRETQEFVQGMWTHIQAEEAAVQGFLDAFIAGLSCVRLGWDEHTKSLLAETVFFDNIIIDNRECSNRTPPRHYRIRQVMPRSVVEARYGVDLIHQQGKYLDTRQIGEGWVVLVEAFRLPDAKGEGGWHMVSSCGVALVDEPWKQPWVPLAFFHFRDPVSGFFPRSGVEMLVPYQMRMNELNDAIEESQDITCRPRILKHAGSNLDVSQWDNEAGRILDYSGIAPVPFEWETDLQTLLNERERVRETAHAYMGLSMMTSQADMPDQVRLDSSAGVREFRNMEDARHLRMWTRYERFRLEIARLAMLVLKTGKGSSSYCTTYFPGGSRARAKNIPYKALKQLEADQYSWSMEAVPLATMSPAARRETIRDWSSRGLLQPGEERRMEGNPNLERIEDLEMASYDDIYRHMEIMEEGGFEAPNVLTNLTFGIVRVTQNLHYLQDFDGPDDDDKVKPEVLIAHQRWIAIAQGIQTAALQAQQQQQMMQQAQAQAQTQGGPSFAPQQSQPGNASPQ